MTDYMIVAWEERVRARESEGLTRSDAQAVIDAEDSKAENSNSKALHALADHFELAFALPSKAEIVPRPIRTGGPLPKPLASIETLLKYDRPYPAFTPVILFDRSLWQKFVALFKRRSQ